MTFTLKLSEIMGRFLGIDDMQSSNILSRSEIESLPHLQIVLKLHFIDGRNELLLYKVDKSSRDNFLLQRQSIKIDKLIFIRKFFKNLDDFILY